MAVTMAVTMRVPVTGAHGASISPKVDCSTSRTATPVPRQTMCNTKAGAARPPEPGAVPERRTAGRGA